MTEGAASQYGDEIIRPPRTLIATQYGGCAPILMMSAGCGDDLYQLFSITKSQIDPQTCERMNAVGGISQQHAAFPDVTAAVQGRERITAASSDVLEMSQLRPKGLVQFVEKTGVIQGHQVPRTGMFCTPDDGGTGFAVGIIAEGQHRERTGGDHRRRRA